VLKGATIAHLAGDVLEKLTPRDAEWEVLSI
jgi:hypothetical protein